MEHEIKTHAVKAYKTLRDRKLKFWHKVSEIGIEIGIIVFAVTLSIWVHDISDHNHEQNDVKSFLISLKQDLNSDLVQLQEDSDEYFRVGRTFTYITSAPVGKINGDSIQKYQPYLFNTTTFLPNNGRYEGFKSSGKLGNIEDDSLQNHITELYQGIIPSILASTDSYNQRKRSFFEYINHNLRRNPKGGNNLLTVLSADECFNICGTLTYSGEICDRYHQAIAKSKKIIAEINKAYNLTDPKKPGTTKPGAPTAAK